MPKRSHLNKEYIPVYEASALDVVLPLYSFGFDRIKDVACMVRFFLRIYWLRRNIFTTP
jgi:hypothetical protein